MILLYGFNRVQAQQANLSDEKAILQVVQQFFDGMEAHDTTKFGSIAVPDAYHYSVRETRDSILVGARTHARFNKSLPGSKNVVKERLRSTGVNVQIHKRIATVWGPYDLWVNNTFSHCGVDVFTLFKTREGWKIAAVAYSVEPEECDK